MMRRNLIVAFKPIKTNSVILSELNHRMMMLTDNNNSCLNLTNNHVDYYCSWLPSGGQPIRDTEIGINASVAEAIGLYEGSIVSCKVVEELKTLDTVEVSATNQKDWEMLEASSYRISNTLLDQTRIVNEGKKLVVWINAAINISINIEKLIPDTRYGKIGKSTEIIVKPFEVPSTKTNSVQSVASVNLNSVELGPKQEKTQNSLYDRLYKKDSKKLPTSSPPPSPKNGMSKVIDSRTLDNVSDESSSDSYVSSEDESEVENHYGNNSVSTESVPEKPKRKPAKFNVQCRLFDAMLNEIKSQDRKSYKFRAIPKKWCSHISQMCDVFLSKHNMPEDFDASLVYVLSCESLNDNEERVTKEYYVNIKHHEDETTPNNIYPSIEINDILLAQLKVPKYSRVVLNTKKTVLNFVERIEIIPAISSDDSKKHEILEDFKRILVQHSRSRPLLMNQDQIFNVCDGDTYVTVKIFPESFRYCLCDAEILRENKLFISEQRRDLTSICIAAEEITNGKNGDHSEEIKPIVHLNGNDEIMKNCILNAIKKNCLDVSNCLRKSNNYLITGPQTTGKSTICKEICEQLQQAPYNCYVETFNCAQNKSRKTESIQKDLRNILTRCVERSPAILLLENLDALAKNITDHTQNGDYYNQVSDAMKYMISSYSNNCAISVIATVTNVNNLNQRLYTSRGNHVFDKIYKISELNKESRKNILIDTCKNNKLECDNVDFDKLANLTEGYTIGYLLQFIDRAIFYSFRNDNNNPTLTNDVFLESLKTTNAYCLQGIENNINLAEINGTSTKCDNLFPGLEPVVTVFEEVLMWPTKYPNIFERSPLRNQAGILLYGPPGTGKTYLVSQISRHWNLRMISVKGPELLAKFIGQSEENVRNLFERARSAKPCVLFFDEFDSIAPRRGHDSTGVTDRVVNQLLTELDGVEELKGVVVVAATSRPDLLDPALLRSGRIDRLVQCDLPTSQARLDIFKSIAQSSSLHLANDVDFNHFSGSDSENYTGADIKSILVSANMIAVKESIANSNQIPDEIYINQKHIVEAFNTTKPSLSHADTSKYKSLYAKFSTTNQEESNQKEFIRQRATLA